MTFCLCCISKKSLSVDITELARAFLDLEKEFHIPHASPLCKERGWINVIFKIVCVCKHICMCICIYTYTYFKTIYVYTYIFKIYIVLGYIKYSASQINILLT